MLLGLVLSVFRKGARAGLPALACVVSATSFLVYACDGGGKPEDANGTALDGSGGPPAADVAVAPADGSALTATVRFVHLAANLGPVDFCLRGAGDDAFTGPVLGGGVGADGGKDAGTASTEGGDAAGTGDASTDGAADDGGEGGSTGPEDTALLPRTMTNYVSFEGSGTFDVAVVAQGQKSCATPLATLKVTVDPSKLTTVVLSGDYGANKGDAGADAGESGTLRLFRVLDDPTLDPKQARVRMVNSAYGASAVAAVQDLHVDVIGTQKTPLADDVGLGSASNQSVSSPQTDALGYTLLAPEPPANALVLTGAADASFAGTWTSVYTDLGLRAASLHTGFIVSDATDTFDVVWCSDTSTVGKRVDCRVLGKPLGDL